jgi:hypothetical protein
MQRSCKQLWYRRVSAVSVVVGLTFCAGIQEAHAADPEPFKFMNIHFETNASACDMGIQILFDTDGVTELSIEDPRDNVVFSSQTPVGMEDTHDQTEGFQERVEPPITELENALGCEPSLDAITLRELFAAWPAGIYDFEASSFGVVFEGERRLTQKIPAGPVITAPADGAVVPHDQSLLIRWNKVTGPILPSLGPVQIVGYHVLVKDITDPGLAGPLQPAQFDIDVSKNETSVLVQKQYLEPDRVYEFEVLATEKGANQTITEGGVFCTVPRAPAACERP